jgi:hypothetical protein
MSVFSLILLVVPAVADHGDVACRSYAQAVADDYMGSSLERAEEGSRAGAGQVLVIAAGKKYYVPAAESGVITSVGHKLIERKRVFWEEYDRCVRGGDITVNFSAAADTAN